MKNTVYFAILFFVVLMGTRTARAVDGGYAIVVSKETEGEPEWGKVVQILEAKYGAEARVFTWEKTVGEVRDGLAGMEPRYACFVAQRTEANREFVGQVHRLARSLGDDPYPGTIWGILTGLDAADAQRTASASEPLVIKSVVGTTGVTNKDYDDVFTVSDGKPGEVFRKGAVAGGIVTADGTGADRAEAVVTAMNTMRPDMVVTSSHAGDNIMEMPWSCGVILAKDGQVTGLPAQGGHGALRLGKQGWAVDSRNPKVWLAAGNCLAGHIANENSIALAMMHCAGVTQMVGYTVTTWYGAGGWGTLGWFQGQAGRYSLAESFFINDVAITRRLAKEYPGREKFVVERYDEENVDGLAGLLGLTMVMTQKARQDLLGLTWDHDSVAFYGDPAWDARIAPHACPFDQVLRQQGDGWALEVTANEDTDVNAFAFLPHRIDAGRYRVTGANGNTKDALLTGGYVMVDFGVMKKGEKRNIAISANGHGLAGAL